MNLKEQLDTLLDATAFDSTGTKVGAVRQVYVDDASGKLTFATVSTGIFSADAIVPLHGARLLDDELHVDHTRAVIRDSPRPENTEDALTPEQEVTLLEHYGLEAPARDRGAAESKPRPEPKPASESKPKPESTQAPEPKPRPEPKPKPESKQAPEPKQASGADETTSASVKTSKTTSESDSRTTEKDKRSADEKGVDEAAGEDGKVVKGVKGGTGETAAKADSPDPDSAQKTGTRKTAAPAATAGEKSEGKATDGKKPDGRAPDVEKSDEK